MREHSRDRGRLEDIVKYAQNVNVIISGISFEEFTKDIRIYYSVMKNIEVIGEAANMLTRHFREIHAELRGDRLSACVMCWFTVMPKSPMRTSGRPPQTTYSPYVSRCNATSLTLTGRNGKKVKILIRK